MKELPYFKFYPSEWFTGFISALSPVEKGIFIELCALSWQKDMQLQYDEELLSKFLRVEKDTLRIALGNLKDSQIIFIEPETNIIKISFLEEQFSEMYETYTKKVNGGKKGAQSRILHKLQKINGISCEANLKDTLKKPEANLKDTLSIPEANLVHKDNNIKKRKEDNNNINNTIALNDENHHSELKKLPAYRIKFNFDEDKWEGITEEDIKQWETAFPACNVPRELNQMHLWLKANPQKKKKNYARFIVNWLQKEQDRGGTR